MSLRNGHNYLRKHLKELLHKEIDANCKCGKGYQTVKHIWEECKDEDLNEKREKARKELCRMIGKDNEALENSSTEDKWWRDEKIKWNKAKEILYINARRSDKTKTKYLQTIIYFFKQFEMENIAQLYRKGEG